MRRVIHGGVWSGRWAGVGVRIAVGLALVVAWAATIAPDCGSGTDTAGPSRITLTVRLANADDQPVHLFQAHESFPCCQVAPDGVRVVTASGAPQNSADWIYRAGRNGQIIATTRCSGLARDGETVRVLFTGQSLSCMGW